MPMNVVKGGPIAGHLHPNSNQHAAAQEVINMLQYADIWRGAGTLHSNATMRLDMQGVIAGNPVQHNLQVQTGTHTVAHANVSASVMTNDAANQRGVAHKVISALQQSLDSGHSYSVTGTAP
jgi:hypothetical protein